MYSTVDFENNAIVPYLFESASQITLFVPYLFEPQELSCLVFSCAIVSIWIFFKYSRYYGSSQNLLVICFKNSKKRSEVMYLQYTERLPHIWF